VTATGSEMVGGLVMKMDSATGKGLATGKVMAKEVNSFRIRVQFDASVVFNTDKSSEKRSISRITKTVVSSYVEHPNSLCASANILNRDYQSVYVIIGRRKRKVIRRHRRLALARSFDGTRCS
jgi:hypothetical protein